MKKANGRIMVSGKQHHTVVQAKTFKRCVELLDEVGSQTTMTYFNSHWSKGCWGDAAEKQLGNPEEEGVWVANGLTEKNGFTKIA